MAGLPFQELVQNITDWAILLLLSVAELYVLLRLKFKIDFSGLLTLFIHFLVSLLRVMNDNAEIKVASQ